MLREPAPGKDEIALSTSVLSNVGRTFGAKGFAASLIIDGVDAGLLKFD